MPPPPPIFKKFLWTKPKRDYFCATGRQKYRLTPRKRKLSKNVETSSKFQAAKSGSKRVPYREPTNIRSHSTKFSGHCDLAPGTHALLHYTNLTFPPWRITEWRTHFCNRLMLLNQNKVSRWHFHAARSNVSSPLATLQLTENGRAASLFQLCPLFLGSRRPNREFIVNKTKWSQRPAVRNILVTDTFEVSDTVII